MSRRASRSRHSAATAGILALAASSLLGASRCTLSERNGNTHVEVVVVHPDTSEALPAGDVHLDEILHIEFSAPVDPDSVTPESIRIRRVDSGARAEGCFVVEGRHVRFVPRLPGRADLADAGFAPGVRFRVEIPAGASGGGGGVGGSERVRGLDGRPLARGASGKFEIRATDPLFLGGGGIGLPGPPRIVLARAEEGGGDGVQRIRLAFSEPVDPRSLGGPDGIRLVDPDGRSVPFTVHLEQPFDPGAGRHRSAATLTLRRGPAPRRLLRACTGPGLRDLDGEAAVPSGQPVLAPVRPAPWRE